MGGVGFWWRGWAACNLVGAARVSPAVGVNTSTLCVTPPKIIIRAWKGAVVVLSIFGGSKGKKQRDQGDVRCVWERESGFGVLLGSIVRKLLIAQERFVEESRWLCWILAVRLIYLLL